MENHTKKFNLNEINFIEEGDIIEEVSDGHSGALLYIVKRKNKKYFLKIFNQKFEYKKIYILNKQLEIYRELEIKSLNIIDFGEIKELEKYYIVYNYIDGQNLKKFTDSNEYDLQYTRNIGRKIGEQLKKLREYNKYDKKLFEFNDINKLTRSIVKNFNLMLEDEKSFIIIEKYFSDFELKKLEMELKKYEKIFKELEPKLIHGDIKRSNIMIDKNQKLYIVDVESMQLNYDIMNFFHQMTWSLFKGNDKETEFVKGYFDGIYENKRPNNFNEQILFIIILNFFNASYNMYKKLNMDKLEMYMTKCRELFDRIYKKNDNKFIL